MSNRIYIGEEGIDRTCDGLHCICVHECDKGEDKIEIWIHGDLNHNRRLAVDRKEILSRKVIEFLNADAYDFVKEIERYEFL